MISPDTRSERRFDLSISIEQLKVRCSIFSRICLCETRVQNKLELFTGIPVQNQRLLLFNNEKDTEPIAVLSDDDRPLGFWGVRDSQVLRVRCFLPITRTDIQERN